MHFLENYIESTEKIERSKATIALLAGLDHLSEENPEIAKAIIQELQDQRSHLKLIASENYSSFATQLAMGNWMTDKYAEGIPFHRFYAACQNVDDIETQAVTELKKLFGADHAYVQPHSGADANLVAYWAILTKRVQNPEVERLGKKRLDELSEKEFEKLRQLMLSQKLMGMSLNSGGHLTHGYRHNISSKLMRCSSYEVNFETGILDYSQLAAQVKEEKPDILLAGYSAYSRLIDFAKMREIADSVGACLMVDMAHFAGLVAGKVLTGNYDPIPFADIVTSTTHKTLRGPRGGIVLCTKEYAELVDKGCPMVLGGPLPHVMAAKAVAFREANTPAFQAYAQQVVKNAKCLAEAFLKRGVPVMTGGTDNHQVILNVADGFSLTGRQCESALLEARCTVNRNAIPQDKNGPWYTSGLRLGTPALTTLGMGEAEMELVAEAICTALKGCRASVVERTGKPSLAKYEMDPSALARAHEIVKDLLSRFPLYPEIPADFAGKKAALAK